METHRDANRPRGRFVLGKQVMTARSGSIVPVDPGRFRGRFRVRGTRRQSKGSGGAARVWGGNHTASLVKGPSQQSRRPLAMPTTGSLTVDDVWRMVSTSHHPDLYLCRPSVAFKLNVAMPRIVG